MSQITQSELSVKYGVSPSMVCKALAGLTAIGEKCGVTKHMKMYDEATAAGKILYIYCTRAQKKYEEFEKEARNAKRIEAIMMANGLIDLSGEDRND